MCAQSFLNWPRLLQNSPSMPSGLAVGIWVRPVRIKTSLFFRELWSIGCGRHNMTESGQNPNAVLLAENAPSAENNANDTVQLFSADLRVCGEQGRAGDIGHFLIVRLNNPVWTAQGIARAQRGDLHCTKQLLMSGKKGDKKKLWYSSSGYIYTHWTKI